MKTVMIYDEHGASAVVPGLAARLVRELVDEDEDVLLRLNTTGGNTLESITAANVISGHPGGTVAQIDGTVASAGSFLAVSARKTTMAANALFMIHNPYSIVFGGDAENLEGEAAVGRKLEKIYANAYASKSKLDEDEVLTAMKAETWYTAEEALEAGFVDEVFEPAERVAQLDLSKFQNPPRQAAQVQGGRTMKEDPKKDPAEEPKDPPEVTDHDVNRFFSWLRSIRPKKHDDEHKKHDADEPEWRAEFRKERDGLRKERAGFRKERAAALVAGDVEPLRKSLKPAVLNPFEESLVDLKAAELGGDESASGRYAANLEVVRTAAGRRRSLVAAGEQADSEDDELHADSREGALLKIEERFGITPERAAEIDKRRKGGWAALGRPRKEES